MKNLKTMIDACMVVLLIALMCVSQTGNFIHELLGILMTVLFVVHQIVNQNFYRNLRKGKFNRIRIAYVVINISLLIFMILMLVSSFMISQQFLSFVGLRNDFLGRTLHIISAYMMFMLCGVHLGLHYNSIIKVKRDNRIILNIFLIIFACVFGVRGFMKRGIITKLQLQLMYPIHFEENILVSLIDYLGILIMFVMIGYGIYQLLMLKNRKER
ncbi:DUF4405 domain-containing protein [[Clostridium] innocuum]|nr:DUF4405 domain-containing protein [[Clostridium] innocuum]